MRTYYWTLLFLAGCGFDGGRGMLPDMEVDAGSDAKPDSPPIEQVNIDFLPAAEETFGDANWEIVADATIDTTALTASIPLPDGVTLLEGTQHDGTSKVAILRVTDFKVPAGRTLTVRGSRPLFILSDHDVTIDGLLDVGAHGNVPGPGGGSAGMGQGAGAASQHGGGSYNDSGGGGGSFSTSGAAGGRAGATASGSGMTYPITSTRLLAGASGGTAGLCTNPPGAGGGALLLFAKHKIAIGSMGVISSGGGGGAGGLDEDCAPGSGAGAGGGSGGTIWLQTPDIKGDGMLTANGGGGGGASYINLGNGGPGEDGKPSLTFAAGGTKANNSEATAGGTGAIEGTIPSMVPNLTAGNGGGGGGGLGRIFFRSPNLANVRSSPMALAAP